MLSTVDPFINLPVHYIAQETKQEMTPETRQETNIAGETGGKTVLMRMLLYTRRADRNFEQFCPNR